MNPVTKNKDTMLSKLTLNKNSIVDKSQVSTNIVSKKYKKKYTKEEYFKNLEINNDYFYDLSNLDLNKNTNFKGKVHICIFTIVNESINPFILYLLYKNPNNTLCFPYIKANSYTFFDNIENKVNFLADGNNSQFKGSMLHNNELYVFYKIDDSSYRSCMLKIDESWWFTLISEICYFKKVLTFDIDEKVFDFFMNNQTFCKLYDKNNNLYRIPHSMYLGSNVENIQYYENMGPVKDSFNSDFGPFYKFTSYELSCRYGAWSPNFKSLDNSITDNDFGRYKNPGIIRYAVFLGKHKTFLNRLNDSEDNNNYDDGSKISKDRKKIVDIHGEWSKNFNSIHRGELGIDKINLKLEKGYMFVVKDINQQFSLSSHILSKNNMDEMYNPDINYVIE